MTTGLLISSLLTASVSSADPASPTASPTPSGDLRVSTSPESERTVDWDRAAGRNGATANPGLPLTRAAARQRVETVSPLPWLSQFGAVVVEQADGQGE